MNSKGRSAKGRDRCTCTWKGWAIRCMPDGSAVARSNRHYSVGDLVLSGDGTVEFCGERLDVWGTTELHVLATPKRQGRASILTLEPEAGGDDDGDMPLAAQQTVPRRLFASRDDGTWDFFLTHSQATGGDQAKTVALLLHVWYDMQQLDKSEAAMEKKGVRSSRNLLIFLGDDFMSRPYCHKELRWAKQYGTTMIGVMEKDDRHGAVDFEKKQSSPPEDLVHIMADVDFDAYLRDEDNGATMLDKIVRKMTHQCGI